MIEIKAEHKEHFQKHGWVIADLNIEKELIDKAHQSLKKMKEKVSSKKFTKGRIYYPHLTQQNLGAIESPFHQDIIETPVEDFFREIQIGNAIKTLFSWEEVYCQLARIFTMKNYSYRGQWHRDIHFDEINTQNPDVIQVGIYTEDQKGFRIWKPEYDFSGKKSILDSMKLNPVEEIEQYLPLKTNPNYYEVIEGKKGTILFFHPGLMHQGSSNKERFDFHMRFTNFQTLKNGKPPVHGYNQNSFQDFKIVKDYCYDFDLQKDTVSQEVRETGVKEKLINSINYRIPFYNFLKFLNRKYRKKMSLPSPWEEDIFSNTIFQKN